MDFNQTKSAFELARDIKNKKISSAELTEFYIQQIKKWNPQINALVEENFEQARAQAKACDEKIKSGNTEGLPPLFGVPMTIKEMISVEGFKLTVGSIYRKDYRSRQDATVVKRLKEAGVIILGTTNVPEMGLWFECNNPVYGDTLNPHNLSRTSGGSSGGEAALLAAGASPLGLGSDIGGSLRMPAAFCGIFAHKPSEKWVPLTGQFPYLHEEIQKRSGRNYPFTVIGPMTRTAVDLRPYLEILMGPDDFDHETKHQNLKPAPTSWKGKKVFVLPSPKMRLCTSTSAELQSAVLKAAESFKKLGAEIIQLPENVFNDSFQLWGARSMTVETKKFVELLAPEQKFSLAKEILSWSWRMLRKKMPKYQLTSLVTVFVESIAGPQQKIIDRKLNELKELNEKMHDYLGEENILLMPVHPRTAPPLNKTLLRPFDFIHTAAFNALGLPATSVPMGRGHQNLPLAVQVIAGKNQDHLCLAAAVELEKEHGGWVRPSSN